MSKSMWYDPTVTLSHNCIWNMVLSARGAGKTFGCLEYAINRWLKHKKQFMYLRRTDVELQLAKDHLMDAINAEEHFPDWKFFTMGTDIKALNIETEKTYTIGSCVALSKAYQLKSVAFPKTDLIIFDEFLLEDRNGRHLPNEINKVLALMETVGRLRPLKLIMLANYISRANIYFDYWKLFPKPGSVFTKHKTKPVLIHLYNNTEFKKTKSETPFAKLIEGTPYGNYMLDNEALADNYNFIEKFTGKGRFWYTFIWHGQTIGVLWDPVKGNVWFLDKHDPSVKTFAFDTDSHEPNMVLISRERYNPRMRDIKYAIDVGVARYANLTIKKAVLELFRYI